MAKTYPRRPLTVLALEAPVESFLAAAAPEGVAQSFLIGWPLEENGVGQLQVWGGLATTTAIWGYALEDATGVTGTRIRYVKNSLMTQIEGNLEDGDGDYPLAPADLSSVYDLRFDANHLGPGLGGWHFDIFDSRHVLIHDFRSTYIISNSIESRAEVGDINAIVRATAISSFQPLGA